MIRKRVRTLISLDIKYPDEKITAGKTISGNYIQFWMSKYNGDAETFYKQTEDFQKSKAIKVTMGVEVIIVVYTKEEKNKYC